MKKAVHTVDAAIVALIAIHDIASFQHYNGKGVYSTDTGTKLNWHAINIVGWGNKNGNKDYWIIKNSWGPTWGDYGYGYIEQHTNLMQINDYIYVAFL